MRGLQILLAPAEYLRALGDESGRLPRLGLALHLYENNHGKFPPGQVIGPLPQAGVRQAVDHGWEALVSTAGSMNAL
jgi:hypothetical protein